MENIALIRSRIWHHLKHLAIDYPEDTYLNQRTVFWKGYKICLNNRHVKIKKGNRNTAQDWVDITFDTEELKKLMELTNGL